MKSLNGNFAIAASIAPGAVIAATKTGSAVHLDNAQQCLIEIVAGTVTDGTHTPKLQECATSGGSYTDVAASDIDGTLAAITSNSVQTVGYLGSKPYLKVVSTVTGSPATGGYYTANVIMGVRKLPA